MPPQVIRDSLAKCTAYSNPYDVRRHQVSPAVMQRNRDSLAKASGASFWKQLEKPASREVQFISLIGKYALLSFAMPLYFLLYGAPKWMLGNIKQFMMMLWIKQVEFKFLKQLFSWPFQMLKKTSKGFNQQLLKILIPFKKSALAFQRTLNSSLSYVTKPFQLVKHRIDSSRAAVNRIYQSLKQHLNAYRIRLRNWMSVIIEKSRAGFKTGLKNLKELLAFPRFRFKNLISFDGKALVLKGISNFLNPIKKDFQKAREKMGRIKEVLVSLSSPIFQKFAEKWGEFREFGEKIFTQLLDGARNLKGKIEQPLAALVQHFQQVVQQWIPAFPPFSFSWIEEGAGLTRAMWIRSKKIGSKIKEHSLKYGKSFKEFLKKRMAVIKTQYRGYLKKGKKLLKNICDFLKNLLSGWIKKALEKTIYYYKIVKRSLEVILSFAGLFFQLLGSLLKQAVIECLRSLFIIHSKYFQSR